MNCRIGLTRMFMLLFLVVVMAGCSVSRFIPEDEYLLNNVNILLNEAPLKSDTEDPVALFKEACKNQEENINVLFNTLNDAMKELAEE